MKPTGLGQWQALESQPAGTSRCYESATAPSTSLKQALLPQSSAW